MNQVSSDDFSMETIALLIKPVIENRNFVETLTWRRDDHGMTIGANDDQSIDRP
jgi:hypothetical protein